MTGRYGDEFALLRAVVGLRRARFVLLDVEYCYKHNGAIRSAVSRIGHRLIARGATKLGMFCKEEAIRYSEWYGIKSDKFIWLPSSTAVDPARFSATDGDYLFCFS